MKLRQLVLLAAVAFMGAATLVSAQKWQGGEEKSSVCPRCGQEIEREHRAEMKGKGNDARRSRTEIAEGRKEKHEAMKARRREAKKDAGYSEKKEGGRSRAEKMREDRREGAARGNVGEQLAEERRKLAAERKRLAKERDRLAEEREKLERTRKRGRRRE